MQTESINSINLIFTPSLLASVNHLSPNAVAPTFCRRPALQTQQNYFAVVIQRVIPKLSHAAAFQRSRLGSPSPPHTVVTVTDSLEVLGLTCRLPSMVYMIKLRFCAHGTDLLCVFLSVVQPQ